jgi:hypothetical protein
MTYLESAKKDQIYVRFSGDGEGRAVAGAEDEEGAETSLERSAMAGNFEAASFDGVLEI